MKNKKKDMVRRYPITIYFHSNVKEEMDAYKVIRSTPRKKTPFITSLVTNFLKDKGIEDINKVSISYLKNLVEGKENDFENVKQYIIHAEPTEINELRKLMGIPETIYSDQDMRKKQLLNVERTDVCQKEQTNQQDYLVHEDITKTDNVASITYDEEVEIPDIAEDTESSSTYDDTVVKGILSMFPDD